MESVNVGKEEHLDFCELPNDLIEEIFAWLPVEYVYGFRTVCEQWNTIFSSASFITRQWAESPPNKIPWLVVPPNRNPWLVFGAENSWEGWPAYSSFTRSWKRSCLSLSFLNRREGGPLNSFMYLGSGAGLFLIQDYQTPYSIYVCNPVTAKSFILPRMTYANKFLKAQVGIVQEGENGYKVLAVYHSNQHEQNIVEIYDSTERAWRMAGVLQWHLWHLFVWVISGGYFYCVAVVNTQKGIVAFNIEDGTSIFLPFPDLFHDAWHVTFIWLAACGSRILCAAAMEMGVGMPEEVIIWEFKKDAATNWEEVARMPPTLYPSEFRLTLMECAGNGDCVYFKRDGAEELAVYNFTQNSWTLLPSCPDTSNYPFFFAFKPMPNMRVE